jgi:transposase
VQCVVGKAPASWARNRARDKAKAEVAVQIATRFVVAKLRNRQFFSLSALNAAIVELVAQINNRTSRHLGASRRGRPS